MKVTLPPYGIDEALLLTVITVEMSRQVEYRDDAPGMS